MCITSNGTLMMPLSAQDVCFNAKANGCSGGTITIPWSFITWSGVVTGGQFGGSGPFGNAYCADYSLPHCHHSGPAKGDPYPPEGSAGCPIQHASPKAPTACDPTAKPPHAEYAADKWTYTGGTYAARGEASIKQFLMEGGPCETAFTVFADFEDYSGGVYRHVTGGVVGGHSVKLVGWGVEQGVKYWRAANSWNPYWGENGYFRIAMGQGSIDAECIASATGATYRQKGPPSPPPSPTPQTCENAMQYWCGGFYDQGNLCLSCLASRGGELEAAGCTPNDELEFCGIGRSPPTPTPTLPPG